ncbi:hypothetical protein BCV70DRAFT_197703 [Testicularia cyperi]|uniref:HTH APSES-type domain-containing protein n=1 Tax=Testicularia cyperi TaxID=1882483 RepID=A0A317XZX0_9BASI|nr:hypothetical protein BCV70DRAFT_197703 [Testicularia cyperi]
MLQEPATSTTPANTSTSYAPVTATGLGVATTSQLPLQAVQDTDRSAASLGTRPLGFASVTDPLKLAGPCSESSQLSFTTTSALQRAGLLPLQTSGAPSSSAGMTTTSGVPSTSESLQRVMGHGAAVPANGTAAGTSGGNPAQSGPLTPAQLKNMTPAQANAALQNPTSNVPTVYLATYSNVPVYEITVRGIAVMRRRVDGWLNATQILKIAGIEKTRRTKILEKSILTGEHEKIQGGYGKFQGTWIPLQRAQEVAAEYNVSHLLKPILEFDPSTADQIPKLYQRRKPATSARNSSASAINDGRSATPSKLYSPAPVSVGGPSQQPRFLSLRPPKGAQQRDMSPALFMPPGAGGLLGTLDSETGSGGSGPKAIPPGSSQAEQDALRSYNVYGYAPQGVPLPSATSSTAAAATTNTSVTGEKRAAGSSGADEDNADGSAAKRSRIDSTDRETREMLGLAPVKDLNSLGPSGGSLRAASAPRGHRMAVGPPDAAGRDGTVPRYADRALPPKPYDEGEKRMRDHLVSLFAEDGTVAALEQSGASKVSAGGDAADAGGASSAKPTSSASGPISTATSGQSDSYVAKLDQLLDDLREKASLGGLGSGGSDGPKATVDLVTDDHGHTALHWASALCRLPLVCTLVARPAWQSGANVHAGNHAGETALHRSVLVTNSYDASSFPALLNLLSPSLNTRDFKKRTVLHHIALVAALKGRAASARYYLACVLEHIVSEKSSKYKGLIDAQDEDGETALGIVARLGNASMVRMLLDVGARKDFPNALGIRPSDWGIEVSGDLPSQIQPDGASVAGSTISSLPPLTAADLASQNTQDIIAALARPAQIPVMKSSEVRDQLTSTLDDLQTTFEKELKEKQDAIATVQSHLQAATRDLAARRRNVAAAQAKLAEKDEARQRVRNLRRTLAEHLKCAPVPSSLQAAGAAIDTDTDISAQIAQLEKDAADKGNTVGKPEDAKSVSEPTGDAMDVDGEEDRKPSVAAAAERLSNDVNSLVPLVSVESDLKAAGLEKPSETVRLQEELVRLRWLLTFYEAGCADLGSRIDSLVDTSAKKETQCQQVVAICANIPQDKVEGMLDELLTAMESDEPDVDLARVANFMQKVGKVGSVAASQASANADMVRSAAPMLASNTGDGALSAHTPLSTSASSNPTKGIPPTDALAGESIQVTSSSDAVTKSAATGSINGASSTTA